MKTDFSESYLSIDYDEALNAIYCSWRIAPSPSEFRQGMNNIIEAMKTHKTGRLMSDTAQIGALDPEDQEWSSSVWLEKAIKEANYSHFAVIVSSDVFAQMSVEDTLLTVQASSTVQIQYFESKEIASQWLMETK